jgi:toxin YhaV
MEVNGWTIYPHPQLLDQLDALEKEVLKRGTKCGAAKVLKWALNSIFEDIPADPTNRQFRQGRTLGKEYTGWLRDKYAGRFRLFFRFNLEDREIIPSWINDEQTLRTRGKKWDAYTVFRKMLDEGNPPNEWNELREEASDPKTIERLEEMRERYRS